MKARRKVLGLTQGNVAKSNGISRVTMCNLENGKLAKLGIRKVMVLCATLRLEIVVRNESANSFRLNTSPEHYTSNGMTDSCRHADQT